MNDSTTPKAIKSSLHRGIVSLLKFAGSTITLAAEVAVVAIVGGYVGMYINNKTIAADCARVNMAKIGDAFIKCTVVELPKDTVTPLIKEKK